MQKVTSGIGGYPPYPLFWPSIWPTLQKSVYYQLLKLPSTGIKPSSNLLKRLCFILTRGKLLLL